MNSKNLLYLVSGNIDLSNISDFEVKGITNNSKNVKDGYIFVAIRGYKDDGNVFIQNAVENGALMIVTDKLELRFLKEKFPKEGLSFVKVENSRRFMALLSNEFYAEPSKKIKLIGITGTNGKTTTAYLIKKIIEACGYRCGLLGTVDYDFGSSKIKSSLTTPESFQINSMLNEMLKMGYEYCVMEVSSIALMLERVYGMSFSGAAYTNLSPEHLDLHRDMEDYFKAKKILFDMLSEKSTAVSNLDDDYGFRIITGSKGKKYFYGIDKNCDYKASDIRIDMNGLEFVIIDRQNIFKIKSSLTGRFNVYNILAAYSLCVNLNLDVNMIIKGIEEFKPVKGRFDKILLPNGAYAVIDYSHTSDSLKNAIEAAIDIRNNQNKKGKIITIFGCGGNKDKMKRPVMGKYSTTLSDVTIITSDNPRYEEPKDIIADILKGVKSDSEFEVIENREDAIRKGISISGNSDIILICGKGHETYQEVKGVRTDFDDYEIVKKYSQLVK